MTISLGQGERPMFFVVTISKPIFFGKLRIVSIEKGHFSAQE